MTKLQERLYQYIAEERYCILQSDAAFLSALRARNEAEARLSAGLTAEQKRLFSRYMDEENHLASLQLRHVFQETLMVIHDVLHVSL